MKFIVLFSILLLTGCAASTPLPAPTPVPTPTPRPVVFKSPGFVFLGKGPGIPILAHDPSPAIDNLYINPGAVVFHDGEFHILFNSFTNWPGVVEIGYATSEDGVEWQMIQDEPVFTTDQVPFGEGKADVSSVLVMDDGTWVIYFHTIEAGEIGRATADSPLGPWTVDPEPILTPGSEGTWDELGLAWPSLVRDGDWFRMYYGVKLPAGHAIGLATSPDGINWTKYNDPETTDAQYAASDPVLVPEGEWEYHSVDRPRVVNSPDGWVMIYQAGIRVEERGLAASNNGITWERYSKNPIFTKEAFPIPNAKSWDTNLLYHDGAYYYFMEIGSLSGTDLYVAKHEGELRK